jgi:hypothetical protein
VAQGIRPSVQTPQPPKKPKKDNKDNSPFYSAALFKTSRGAGFFCFVCFLQHWGLNSGHTPWATPPALFFC